MRFYWAMILHLGFKASRPSSFQVEHSLAVRVEVRDVVAIIMAFELVQGTYARTCEVQCR